MKITIEINEEHEAFKKSPGETVREILIEVSNLIRRGMVEGDIMDLGAVNVCTWSVRLEQ